MLEKRTTSKANAITTVSSFFENQIRKQVPNTSFSIIPNGFDEQSMEQVEGITQGSEILRIAFVGTIYEWHPLTIVLETLNRWVTKFPERKIELHFYGTNKNRFISEVVNSQFPGLIDIVQIYPKLPNQELVQKLAEYNALLLFNYYAFMGTKIYDYLGLKRKILFCFTDDPESKKLKKRFYPLDTDGAAETLQEELIVKTNAGILVSNADDLIEALNSLYLEHKEFGQIICNSTGTEQFSRRLQVARLADFVKNLR
jgi:hypothetical protein